MKNDSHDLPKPHSHEKKSHYLEMPGLSGLLEVFRTVLPKEVLWAEKNRVPSDYREELPPSLSVLRSVIAAISNLFLTSRAGPCAQPPRSLSSLQCCDFSRDSFLSMCGSYLAYLNGKTGVLGLSVCFGDL